MNSVVDDHMKNSLIVKVTKEEVRKYVHSMNQFKALGPDGFPLHFFRIFLDIVKYDISHVAWDFVRMGTLLKELNQIFIVLLPKTDGLRCLKEFKPISLCNTIYKILSKVIMNCIKPLLDNFIGPYQNGFFPGRHIGCAHYHP